MLLIYSSSYSSRLKYIIQTLFSGIINFQITTDIDKFRSTSALSNINYSATPITENELQIIPQDLLFEDDIKSQKISCSEYKGRKIFFQNSDGYPFDIFAASFYLLSRYEEYLPHEKDEYGRYAHHQSLAFREDFLNIPLVNFWIEDLVRELKIKYPGFASSLINQNKASFSFIPTYDIDIAYSYLHKGFFRNAGGLLREFFSGRFNKAGNRISVLTGKKKDPFDSYEWMNKLHETHQLKPIIFFLVANNPKGYDKNIPPSVTTIKNLIEQLGVKYDSGIHPSWQSGDRPELIQQEKEGLQNITGKEIVKSRQHYIRMNLPDTFRHLINSGIKEDYSMGYGSINGFRASYAKPFNWYDLEREEETSLKILPFCFMDANSFYEQKFSMEQTGKELAHYLDVVKQVNGTLITIWHNNFLGVDKSFTGWREVYEDFIKKVNP